MPRKPCSSERRRSFASALGSTDAVAVIGAHRPRRSAEQCRQRLARRLAQRVPERHVEARHRHADQALPAEQSEFRVHRRHQVERRDRLAGQVAADLLDQVHQRLERQPRVGEDVGASGDALIGLDIDQHQRRRLDHAEGVLHRPRDRRDDGPCLDAANGWTWLRSCLFPHSTLYHRTSRGAAQSVAIASISQRPAYSAENAMRWVCPGSIASVSSQNGFQPSSSRSSSRK